MILGHRGMGVMYNKPANSYGSIIDALGIGADGCEVDVQLTKDSVLVLFHDETLNELTNCSGKIYDCNWSDIEHCRYLAFDNTFTIVSADELFGLFPDIKNYYFSFDCKLDDEVVDFEYYQSLFLRAIKRLCEKYDMENNVFIECVEPFLTKAKTIGLTNKLFLVGKLDQTNIDKSSLNGFFGISTAIDNIMVSTDNAHVNNLYVMGYSPRTFAENKEAIRKKIDILQTDDPVSILKFLNRFNYEYLAP